METHHSLLSVHMVIWIGSELSLTNTSIQEVCYRCFELDKHLDNCSHFTPTNVTNSGYTITCTHFAHTGVTNKAGQTPLSLASAGGHLDTVKYLVEVHRCDPRRELFDDLCFRY